MKAIHHPGVALAALSLSMFLALPSRLQAYSPNPDLTGSGAITTLKTDANASPVYGESYNLGPTGLRGWIYIDRNNMGNDGLQTAQSRQILVSMVGASTPADGVLAVDDVILGAKGGTGTVTAFTSDCRKAFGWAIGDAETAANAGVLSLLRWRGGATSTVTITLPVMGSYTTTAPYGCPKSSLILANARNYMVNQLLAGQLTLSNNLGGAVTGLALLGGVAPGDPNYAAVQTRLQTFAHGLVPQSALSGCATWDWGYIDTFLSEYYLRSVADGAPDASVLPGINAYTVGLARMQSMYGTFGHGGAEQHADGSLHGSISWYGPVNSAGLGANIGIVIGKKALQTGGQTIDPEIDPAITRAANFFGWYVNKGSIPYGEHEPYSNGHASNGKDAMCAVLFGLQDNRPTETEFFTRITTAGCTGREYGHTGQGFSYLWGAMGSNMGGQAAVAAYLNNVRWHLDLERRSDGSFVYDGGEQYGAGTTADGTYLGSSEIYGGMIPSAWYVLSYALPLQRLYITGRNANSANILDSTKVTHSIAAATYKLDCTDTVNYPVSRLMTDLGDYDPAIRAYAADELHNRTLTTAEENTLITMAEGSSANARMGACETLGLRLTTAALPALGRRLSDSDYWVRGKAANALKNFSSAASPQLTTMLTAFVNNATDPNVIVWTDPIQISNGYLAYALFQTMGATTIAADKSLLYPAVRAGLKQPDGMARMYLSDFIQNRLTWADVQAVAPSLVDATAERSPADRMFSDVIRDAGMQTMAKFKIEEGIPLCLMNKEQAWHSDDWTPFNVLTNTYRGAAKDALPTLYKWQAHLPQFGADSSVNVGTRLADITSKIASTIAAIENDTNPPTLANFKTVTVTPNPAVVTLPSNSTVLTAAVTDLDSGTPNFVWSKLSGAGNVTFTPNGETANTTCTATFNTPGSYVLRATAVDRSILDYKIWITYCLGYYDFQTYNEILGGVSKDITVNVLPDPNHAPNAQNQSLITALNTAAAITLTATDADSDPLTYAVVTQPAHGLLSGTAPNLTYTPVTGFTGADSFTFKANDGKVDSAAATVTINVGSSGNHQPVANNQSVTTAETSAKSITLTGSDPDSDPLTYAIVSGPSHGTLSGTPPNMTYLPAPNFPASNLNGTDSFTFTANDGSLTSSVAMVSITVTPVNNPPVAQPQSLSVSVNTANPIILTGTDPEGYAVSYTVLTSPSHGTLDGTAPNLTYTPTTNYHGTDSFTFTVTDSEGLVSSAATISITIINDPPVANAQSAEVPPNTGTAITLTGSDDCNDTLTYAVLIQPAHGTLSGTAPNLTYTPTAGYTGADSFTFKVNDGVSDSPAATVTINVAAWTTWTNIAPGNWSATASWSGGVSPAAGGSTDALLVFNTSPYATASTNDLTSTFQLNRLNLGSALPAATISGNALSFASNSSSLPQINQNSANAVTISNNIALAANATFGGTAAGAVTLSGLISGSGSLTQANAGILTIGGSSTNTFTGGIAVNAGTLVLNLNRLNLGAGPVTLAGGTTFYTSNFEGNSSGGTLPNTFTLGGGVVTLQTNKDIWITGAINGTGCMQIQGSGRTPGVMLSGAKTFSGGVKLGANNGGTPMVTIDNNNSLGTGTLRSELVSTSVSAGNLRTTANLTTSPGVTNTVDLAPGCRLVVDTGSYTLWLSGAIIDSGNLIKIGTGTLTLSGSNTYTGTTTVAAGTLALSNAASLGHGALAISSSAKAALNFTGTRQVSALSLAGVAQPNGVYGASNSPTYFSGTGTVTVATPSTTTLALTGGSASASLGDPLTFTATVSGSAPTGNVSFYAGATPLGTSALNGSFQASVTTSSLAAGSYNITAQYVGDTNNGASTSAALPIQIIGALTPPAAPTNLVATPASKLIVLTWTGSGDATSYIVKRSLTSGGPYASLAYTSTSGFSDTQLTNGTAYYYVVSATNGAGESSASGQASAIPVNQAPVATAQSVTTAQDTAKAITLAATDVDGDSLTYAIVTAPAHGSLSGTAPNVTYTPNSGYGGSDSFTFKANDGTVDSAPATVSITVVGTVSWTNIAPGNWSTGTNWSGGTAPTAGGSTSGLLVFNTTPYATASTNDLAGSFLLNRWNFGSSLAALTVSGNALSFVANISNLPVINQGSANAVTVSNNIALTTNITVSGTGAGALTLSGVISGAGNITKTSSGILTVSGLNTYGGGTTVTTGTLSPYGNGSGSTRSYLGTGTVTMNGGTTFKPTDLSGQPLDMGNDFILSGGTVNLPIPFGGGTDCRLRGTISGPGGLNISGGTRWAAIYGTNTFSGGIILNDGNKVQINTVSGLGTGTLSLGNSSAGTLGTLTDLSGGQVTNTIDLTSARVLTVDTSSGGLNLAGTIQNTGGLTKSGTNTLTLSGTNTYTGTTTVSAGTLAVSNSSSLGHGALAISSGAKVALNNSGTARVSSLSFAGSTQANGSWGSTSSIASNKNDTCFSGTGVLGVGPATTTALALTGGVTPSNLGASLTFSATVSGSTPTGNVYFYADSTLIGTSALNGSYQASLTTSSLSTGSYNITAQYAGNAGNAASSSSALPIQVLAATGPPPAPTNLASTPGSNSVGLTWTASTGATGYNVKRATVSGGPYATVGSPGAASYNDSPVTNGTTYYYAVSATNSLGESANSSQVSAIPQALASTTTVGSSPSGSGSYGATVTFTATVTSVATGTVTFKEGATVIGSGTVLGGIATLTINTLTLGGHSVTAAYGGDATYLPSSSSALAYTVNKAAVTITGVTAANKVYDGNTTAVLTGGAVSGIVSGETVTVVPGTGAFADANVGTNKAVTGSGYALGGANAGNYTLSAQPGGLLANITALPVVLGGTRVYDGSATAGAGILSISNNLDGNNLSLTGSAGLAGKDAGTQALVSGFMTPARVNNATGAVGSAVANSVAVTLTAPAAGNTLVAVIATRSSSAGAVTGIANTGTALTWTRAVQSTPSTTTTTEIWYAPVVAGAGTSVTISLSASIFAAAVIDEYSGLLTTGPLDVSTSASNSSSNVSPSTGTTATTTQANELWIGGIGLSRSSYSLTSVTNSFVSASVNNASSGSGTASNNARAYLLEKIVTATGMANSGGATTSSRWSGAIATFKAAPLTSLALTGTAAGNYTLAGMTGSVTITPKPLAVAGISAGNRTYDGGTAASLTGTAALLAAESVGTGTTGDGKPYTGDTLSLGGTPGGTFANKHAGNLKPVTVTGVTLTGALAGDYSVTQPAGLTGNVTLLPITVTAVTANKTYDGTTAATGTPTIAPALVGGDTATVLTQAFQDSNAGSGNKTIIPSITINDGNGGANYAVTLANYNTGTISQAAATVTLGNLAATYDGSPKAATATTVPSGRTVTFTYNGSSSAPTNAGSYTVVGTISDINYTGSASGTLVIAKAAASVALGNLAATYDGSPQAATATTVPSGRTVAFTYDGSSVAPTNAGSYVVVGTISDTNYAGSATDTLVIGESLVGSWKACYFTPQEITAGDAVDNADSDGDGFTNLTEYIMGTNPKVPSPQPITLTPSADNHLTLSFFARIAAGAGYAGLTRIYTLEATSDPSTPDSWQGVTGFTHIVGGDNTVDIPLINDSLKKFYRLSVRLEQAQ